jgi:2-polyprenyl-3-methyl-5-hydroxy-6-metoxy-1,4-benzoquinol methylase
VTANNGIDDPKADELATAIRQIQERVRAQHPSGGTVGGTLAVPLPDLMPIVHARDAAEAKVAAIGSVNPRAAGIVNNTIQSVKRTISRSLGWFVRDQVEFNRGLMRCVDSVLEALTEANRSIAVLAGRIDEVRRESESLREENAAMHQEIAQLYDMRTNWIHWREEWDRKLFTNEVQFLRSVADLQSGFSHRSTTMEQNFRDSVNWQHGQFTATAEKSHIEIQRQLWADVERIRLDFERIIHSELRLVRQRAALAQTPSGTPPAPAEAQAVFPFDYAKFAEKFRGTEDYVRERQRFYIPFFQGCKDIVDLGCGRGEFLEVMRDAGIKARGIDLDRESVELCKSKGLEAEIADLFAYLSDLADGAIDGLNASQVIEHLPPERLPELVKLASTKLRRGGVLALETPNPECLAIFSTHFYLDPTHTRPIPPQQLAFYLEEFGFGKLETHRHSPAIESMPSLASIPQDFREAFFGALDYAITATRL